MSWEDKAIKRIGDTNKNLEDMKGDILSWAANTQMQKHNQNFWERQKLFIWISVFLFACAYGLYFTGFIVWIAFVFMGAIAVWGIIRGELSLRKVSRNTPP